VQLRISKPTFTPRRLWRNIRTV